MKTPLTMKLVPFLCFTACLLIFKPAVLTAQEFLATTYPDRITLTLTDDPAHTQSVSWRTDATVNHGLAEIRLEDSSPAMDALTKSYAAITHPLRRKEGGTDHYHQVTFSGLNPAATYVYRVGDGEHWSEWFQFRTASDSKTEPFSFIYLGDGQNDLKSRWSRTIRQAFRHQPDARFIVHAGDLINRANTDAEWGQWHYGAGFIHSMIPVVPTPGNHDHFSDSLDRPALDPHWPMQFVLPENGPEGYRDAVYYTDYQNVRVISLNSQLIRLDEKAMEVQRAWLEGVLKDNPQQWTIVTMHHPVYSTAKNRDNKVLREQFKPLFDQYGVDLVLQGHDHTYARGRGHNTDIDSPVYVVSVAGPKMYESDSERWMDVSLVDTQLYQTIHITGNKLEFKAYNVSGELVDKFELNR